MEDTLRVLVAFALTLFLVMLRLEAERFGAAEYDEEDRDGQRPALRRRASWYLLGAGGAILILLIHPAPGSELFMGPGDRRAAIILGFLLGAIGVVQAAAVAWYHFRRIRLPAIDTYPGALLNAIATAFVDEAIFRGAMLGFLVVVGIDPLVAVVIQALVYTLATRLGAPGRDRYMFVLALGIGLIGGWVTTVTGGFAAAFLAHGVTRFAVFLTTGHTGQLLPRGLEVEDIERKRRMPDGWRLIQARDGGRGLRERVTEPHDAAMARERRSGRS